MTHSSMDSDSMEFVRTPPHSIPAEQSVLGALMVDNDAWEAIADRIDEADFYWHEHRLIYRTITELVRLGIPFDSVTVHDRFAETGRLESIGGATYLGTLSTSVPSTANIAAYANIVRERAVLRQLIQAGTEVANSGYATEGRPLTDLLDEAEHRMFEIANRTERGRGAVPLKDSLRALVERTDELFNNGSSITGIPTGLEEFDKATAGLQPSDLVIVAGRPSMGKTSLAMRFAEYAALLDTPVPVAVFSMEMPVEQLTMRMVAGVGRINMQRLRTGQLEDDDWPRLTSGVGVLKDTPIYIDDTPALSPTELRARARRLKRQHGIGLIVVDYLQLMQVPSLKENRTAEISEITRNLKALAKELQVPVVALSQLNRSVEQRANKRPVMSDLRDSGSIEQDADMIIMLYRDEVYNPESPDKGSAEIIIGKQRNGPTTTVRSTFVGKYARYENPVPTGSMGGG